MSIDMYLDASDEQARSVSALAASQIEVYQKVQTAIRQFVSDTESLKGAAYDSARQHYSEVLLPLTQGAELLMEKIKVGFIKLPQAYREEVDTGDLRQWDLEEKIHRAEWALSAEYDLLDSFNALPLPYITKTALIRSQELVCQSLVDSKRLLEEKLHKLLQFNESSKRLFSEIEDLQLNFTTGLQQANSAWNAQQGVFVLPRDLTWAQTLSSKYKELRKEEQQFISNLQEQYGFDELTARQIFKVKKGIDKKFSGKSQKEKDYLLLRVLGGISYGGFSWDNTAGSLEDYFYTYATNHPSGRDNVKVAKSLQEILEELGLTSDEAKNLQYNVRKQHDFSGVQVDIDVDEDLEDYERRFNLYKQYHRVEGKSEHELKIEFENAWTRDEKRYRGKTDFTHQVITTATHLSPKRLQLSDLYGGRENVKDLSGWKGDITNAADAEPSIENDDYKADLDSVNIVKRMDQNGQSYIQASNDYYQELVIGETNRAKEFKSNVGWKQVEDTAFLYNAPAKRYLTSEEKRAYIKDNVPIVHNFLESLKNNQNELQEYIKIERAEE